MNEKLETVKFKSFNCKGLREKNKQNEVFAWLRIYHHGIILLQETCSTKHDEQYWAWEWGGNILYSHGLANSRGVAILFPKDRGIEI